MRSIRGGSRQSRVVASAPYKSRQSSMKHRAGYQIDRSGGGNGGGNNKVYVGNLSWEVEWQDLKDHMKKAGNVIRADVQKEPSGRSKGYGLVEYATAREAKNAISRLNDTELDGRLIFVREDREAGGEDMNDSTSHTPPVAKLGVSRFVYVGNLSWEVAWQDLKDHMKTVGEVLRADVLLEPNGRSKGGGIVEYASVELANEAILRLNNTELKGRLIFVREDREASESNGPRGGGFSGGGGGGVGCRLYVGNLAWGVRWQDLKDHFKDVCPNIVRADVMMEDDGNRSKGYGIVEFSTPQEARRAMNELNDSMLQERQIFVREDREENSRY